jgi:hypothetical protein
MDKRNHALSIIQQAVTLQQRINNVGATCGQQMSSDPSLVTPCMNFVTAFKNHMQQLFNETKSDVQKILLDEPSP